MKIIVLSLLILTLSITASSQTLFPHRLTGRGYAASFQHAVFDERFSGNTGFIATLGGAFPLPGGATLMLELPLIQGSSHSSDVLSDEFGVGNPLIAFRVGAGANTFIDIGGRLPLANSDNLIASEIANMTDIRHFGAYTPELLQVSAAATIEKELSPSLVIMGRLGPSAMFHTKESSSGSLYAEYGAGIETRVPDLAIWISWGALTQISNTYGTDNTIDEAEIGGTYWMEHTGISVRLRGPLDEYLRRTISATYGVSLTYAP